MSTSLLLPSRPRRACVPSDKSPSKRRPTGAAGAPGAEPRAGGPAAASGPPSGPPTSVGGWVAYYRERAGRSQAELSRLTGVPQSTISLIEATGNARADTLQQLAPGLGVSVGALFGESVPGLAPEEAGLVDAYRRLSEAARGQLRAYLEFLRVTPNAGA